MQLDIKLLRVFVTIVEENSITAAAIKMHVAQPWLSLQLKALEESLGVELYSNRTRGKLGELTPTGQALVPLAKDLVETYLQTAKEVRALLDSRKRRLVLGIEPISLFIPRRDLLVNRLLSEPSVDLEIVTRTPGELVEGFRNEAFDLILTCLPVPGDDVEQLEVHSAPLNLAIPKTAAKNYPTGRWNGLRVLTMPEDFHPAHHWWVKDSLAHYDVQWIICPEPSFEALVRFSEMMKIATLSPDFSARIPELGTRFEMRQFPEPGLDVSWALMKRRGEQRMLVERTWRLAKELLASNPT